jgi:hypothetical protein
VFKPYNTVDAPDLRHAVQQLDIAMDTADMGALDTAAQPLEKTDLGR